MRPTRCQLRYRRRGSQGLSCTRLGPQRGDDAPSNHAFEVRVGRVARARTLSSRRIQCKLLSTASPLPRMHSKSFRAGTSSDWYPFDTGPMPGAHHQKDQTPTVGLEPTTTRLRALRSAD